jgi:fibronectin-binding autotransporter adhesin
MRKLMNPIFDGCFRCDCDQANRRFRADRIAMRSLGLSIAWFVLSLFSVASVHGQALNVGSSSDLSNAVQMIDNNPGTNYTLNVINGFTMGQQVLDFKSNATITLSGNSNTIDGANLYQPLIIDSGTVTLQNLNFVNTGSPVTVNNGATLIDTTGSLQGPVVNNYLVEFNNLTSGTYGGNMSGGGGVSINGAGPVTFSGTNSYTGGTLVAQGSSLIGTTNSLQGTFVDFGAIQFNQATSGTYSGLIEGNGSLQISGGATITLTGLNTYQGGTMVDAGSKLIGTTSSLQGAINDNGAVQFNQATGGSYSGALSGTGSVEISGGGAVTFTGRNSYTGGTIVDQGSTLIGNSTSLQGLITNSGAIQFNQVAAGTFAGKISGAGSVEISGVAPVSFTGPNTYTGGTTVDDGSTLILNASSLQGRVIDRGTVQFSQSGTGEFYGNISGSGKVEVLSNATVTLGSWMGTNTYTGGTTVDAGGTLIGNTCSLHGSIIDNGIVRFDGSVDRIYPIALLYPPDPQQPVVPADPTIYSGPTGSSWGTSSIYSGVISGTGKVEISGGDIVSFVGSNTYSGGTTIEKGSSLTGSVYSLQGNIVNNGFLRFDNSGIAVSEIVVPGQSPNSVWAYFTQTGNISGTGGVDISSGNPVVFLGTNTYTGGTLVESGGALIGTTNSVQGNITNNGLVEFDQGIAGTYAGNMTGGGRVVVSGTGPFTFSGVNSYTGGTTIDSGSTLIGTTRSLQGSIFDSGTVQFNQTTSGTYAGVISGTGGVEIGGVGPVTFSGANTYTGGTKIDNDSTFIIAGSITSNVDVNNGGTLMGTGLIAGNTSVNAGGTIAPGTVGAPLNIKGNFIQAAGSTYAVEVNSTGSDKIAVNGAAQISNATKLNLNLDPGTLTVGKHYEILSATSGLTGQYALVQSTTTAQNVVFTEQYDANNLQVIVNSNLAQNVQSSNLVAVASVLDRTSGTATGDYANTLTQLTTLGPGQLSGALNQLSGDIYPSLGTVEIQTTTVQMQLLSNRLAGLAWIRTSPSSVAQRTNGIRLVSSQSSNSPPSDGSTSGTSSSPLFSSEGSRSQSWMTWGQGYGLGGSFAGDGNAGGLNYRLGGTLFGVERWIGQNLMIGLLGGYAGTSVGNRQDCSSAQISAYQVGLYELYRHDNLYLSNIDAFGNNSYNVSRPLTIGNVQQTASSNSSGNQWAHYTEGGMNFDFDELRLQPFAGVQYLYLNQQAHNESGAGTLDLMTSSQIINSVRSSFGGRLYHETTWGKILFVPTLAARYQHEWGNGTQLVTSSFSGAPTVQFVTSGNHTGRDFGLFTLGATAYVTNSFSVYGMVDTQVASGYSALIGSGGLQYAW